MSLVRGEAFEDEPDSSDEIVETELIEEEVEEQDPQARAEAKAAAARAAIEDAAEGTIRRPTRAELILAALWAAALAPVVAVAPAGVALAMAGRKELEQLARSISGHDAWELMFVGTAFFLVLAVLLAPKTRERRLADARVLVFERGRSFGPSVLLLATLVELGALSMILSLKGP